MDLTAIAVALDLRHPAWRVILLVTMFAAIWAAAIGFTYLWHDGLWPVWAVLAAVVVAVCYHRREPRFTFCLVTLTQIILFSIVLAGLTYLGATMDPPLIDSWLVGCDRALGINLPEIIAWCSHHPWIAWALACAYDSMLWQTTAVVAILSWFGDRRSQQSFVLRMMLAGLVTLAFFLVLPAEGPFSAYGYAANPSQAAYLKHFHALRSGTQTWFSLSDIQGLITFPSFHTIWALLLVAAVARRPFLCVPFAALNAAVIVSTLTTGWHYGTDVVAGALVAAVVCLAIRSRPSRDDCETSHLVLQPV